MTKRILLIVLLLSLSKPLVSWKTASNEVNYTSGVKEEFNAFLSNFYTQLDNTQLSYEAFSKAVTGYYKLHLEQKLSNSEYLTIVDMTMSSKEKRCFVIHLPSKTIVHQTVVAHGKNTGVEFAHKFSNKINSHQSSIGFYKTAETYYGKHGLSLRLDGLEFTNSNARKRAIVIHSADYASQNFIEKYGRLGRSYGCPSLPKKDYLNILNKIKGGSALFVYYPHEEYLQKSTYINVKNPENILQHLS